MKEVLFLICMTVVVSAMAYTAMDYMPVEVGNFWVYRDSSSEGIDSSMTRIPGTTIFEGIPCYVVEEGPMASEENDTSFWFFDDGALFVVQYDPAEEGDFFLINMLPASFELGSSWDMLYIDTTWTVEGYEYFYTMHITGSIDAEENVVVPAGVFIDCPRILNSGYYKMLVMYSGMLIDSDSSDLGEGLIWLAEHVGVVKSFSIDSEDGSETVSILTRYNFSGIDEAKLPSYSALSAFPNPFNAAVSIDVPENVETVEFFDLSGRLVDSVPVVFGQARWNPPSGTSGGIYLAKTKSGSEWLSKKIVYLK